MADECYEHKKVFFLRPRDTLLIDMLKKLRKTGYEVYEIPSLTIMEDILRKYKNAFLFVNIDDNIISEECWLYTIKGLKVRKEFQGIKVGVFHYSKDYLSKSFLLDVGIDLGFIQLSRKKGKLKSNFRIVLAALQANEALGRRKSIRLAVEDRNYKVDISCGDRVITGDVLDMSYMGIGCSFPYTDLIKEKSLIDNIVIKGENTFIDELSGLCLSKRGDKIVIVFNKKKTSLSSIKKINNHIQTCFNNEFKKEVNKIAFLEDSIFHLNE